jgi:hypothetical protein
LLRPWICLTAQGPSSPERSLHFSHGTVVEPKRGKRTMRRRNVPRAADSIVQVDAILMTPPRRRNGDLEHVMAAWDCLTPGGLQTILRTPSVPTESGCQSTPRLLWLCARDRIRWRRSVEHADVHEEPRLFRIGETQVSIEGLTPRRWPGLILSRLRVVACWIPRSQIVSSPGSPPRGVAFSAR